MDIDATGRPLYPVDMSSTLTFDREQAIIAEWKQLLEFYSKAFTPDEAGVLMSGFLIGARLHERAADVCSVVVRQIERDMAPCMGGTPERVEANIITITETLVSA